MKLTGINYKNIKKLESTVTIIKRIPAKMAANGVIFFLIIEVQ